MCFEAYGLGTSLANPTDPHLAMLPLNYLSSILYWENLALCMVEGEKPDRTAVSHTDSQQHVPFCALNFLPTTQSSAFASQEGSILPAEEALACLQGEKAGLLCAAKAALTTPLAQGGSHQMFSLLKAKS